MATGDRAVDGSGLGRSNRASPRQVAQLLIAMDSQPGGKAFSASLPMAGQEGTLANRMRGTAADGRCRAKTGTLTGVSDRMAAAIDRALPLGGGYPLRKTRRLSSSSSLP